MRRYALGPVALFLSNNRKQRNEDFEPTLPQIRRDMMRYGTTYDQEIILANILPELLQLIRDYLNNS